jgi:hypothetical protein
MADKSTNSVDSVAVDDQKSSSTVTTDIVAEVTEAASSMTLNKVSRDMVKY